MLTLNDLTTVLPAGKARVPHLPWPPRRALDGSFGVVDQDSPAHVAQRAAVVIALTPGDLLDDVKLGTPDQALRPDGAQPAEILAALRLAEPTISAGVTAGEIRALAQQITETIGSALDGV